MTTSPFDQTVHPREGDGKFATKPAGEVAVELDEIEPPSFGPSNEDVHNVSYAVQRIAEEYHGLLAFADRVSEVIEEDLWHDVEPDKADSIRFLDMRTEDAYSEYSTELTLRDADGNAIASTNRSGWESWYSGVGADYACPDVPSDFHAPAGTLDKDPHDVARVVVDLDQLRDYDWAAREKKMREDLAHALS